MTPLVPSVSALRLCCLTVLAAFALGGCVTDSKPASELPAAVQTAAKPDVKPDDPAKDGAKDDKGKPDKPGAKPDTKPKPAAAAAAQEDPGPPLERHEVAGTCWMIADKRGGSMDAKIKLVDQCIDERMKADAAKRAGAASR
jgi:hypothetical protein